MPDYLEEKFSNPPEEVMVFSPPCACCSRRHIGEPNCEIYPRKIPKRIITNTSGRYRELCAYYLPIGKAGT